jgi:hypothetical protein
MNPHFLKLKTICLWCLLGWSTSVFAHHDPEEWTPAQDLRYQIIQLVEKPNLNYTDIDQTEADLHFVVNAKGEAVVLFVETKSDFMEAYLKRRLNYQKLKEVSAGQYKIKIIIKSSSSSI